MDGEGDGGILSRLGGVVVFPGDGGLILAVVLAVVEEMWVYLICVVLSVALSLGLNRWGHLFSMGNWSEK